MKKRVVPTDREGGAGMMQRRSSYSEEDRVEGVRMEAEEECKAENEEAEKYVIWNMSESVRPTAYCHRAK